jgi:hypothetical protein
MAQPWEEIMLRPPRAVALVVLAGSVAMLGAWVERAAAQTSTPVTSGNAAVTLVEHADHVTQIDLGDPGPSIGDMLVWGPDPLYDERDNRDTGATTYGTCIAFNAATDCIAAETILFPDGGTLELQGIELAGGKPSSRTIVGGSGRYLGAAGTMAVTPSADLERWRKTITFAPLAGRP